MIYTLICLHAYLEQLQLYSASSQDFKFLTHKEGDEKAEMQAVQLILNSFFI